MIRLNGQEIPVYPSGYDDNPVVIKTDSFSIKGNIERHQFPSKKQVKMEFPSVNPEQVRFFRQLFDAAGTVAFYNDQSNYGVLSFTGIMTECSASSYHRGGSLLSGLSITIREV